MRRCTIRRCAGCAAALLAASVALAGAALAQAPPPPPGLERGPEESRPPLPEFQPETPPAFELPPVPRAQEGERPLSQGPRVLLQGVRLVGHTVFTEGELAALVAPWLGREVASEELLELRDALTRHYVERGYLNSGAVIPDQVVEDGILTVQIVEGVLEEIRVTGLQSLRPSFVEDRLRLGAGPPLDVDDLRERIQLLLSDPAIDQVNARLGPGARPGRGRLEIDVVEAPRFQHEVRFANDRSPSVGAERGELAVQVGNLFGRSDPLRLELGLSRGLRDAQAGYSVPLTARDLRAFVVGEVSASDVVEAPFSEIDVESENWSLQLGLSWPVIRTPGDELRLDLSLHRQQTTTFLRGEPFPFSEGVEDDGESNVTALRFAQQWQRREAAEVTALRSTLSLGMDALGATANVAAPDGRFFAWLGQAQYARRLNAAGWEIGVRGDVQLTPDPLLPIERIAIGGVDTVRGYRENQLVRDNGWDASAELRVPLPELRVPGVSVEPGDGALQLVGFIDAGGGWNNDAETPDPDVIWSVGPGLRWQPNARISARLDLGIALRDPPEGGDDDLQDLGLHFEIRAALY